MVQSGLLKYSVAFFFILSLILKTIKCSQRIDPLVQTSVGLIKGLKEDNYSMFLGIPYAQVDSENPFGISLPHPQFEGIFEANDSSSRCPQPYESWSQRYPTTLDCLRLNIYVPNSANSKNLLPVLVWIHGGAFISGSGSKDTIGPSFLVRHDIILVTINYRLSVYGFMCLDDPRVAGNQGLKDQRAALRWIKENIKAFGGNVDKITLAGESAGSVSVDFHLLYNKDNTFSQAILQSGTILSPWAVTEPNYNATVELATYMGFYVDNTTEDVIKDALEYLAHKDPEDVVEAANDLNLEFYPCIEKEFDDVEPLYTNDVKNTVPNIKDKSVFIGSNDDECLYLMAFEDIEKLGNMFEVRLKDFYGLKDDLLKSTEEIVRHFYIGDKKVNNDVKVNITDFESDYNFLYPIERSIQRMQKYDMNVFRYVFSYDGNRNTLKTKMNITYGGASHADELGYLFDDSLFTEKPNNEDQQMIDRMTELWANFVKYGNPTPVDSSELISVDLPPITDSTMPYLELNSELSVKNRPFEKRMAFWDLLYAYVGKENSYA